MSPRNFMLRFGLEELNGHKLCRVYISKSRRPFEFCFATLSKTRSPGIMIGVPSRVAVFQQNKVILLVCLH